MFKKRLLTLSLAFIMTASVGFSTANCNAAYAKETTKTTQEETKKELEKVVKSVKTKVPVPESCTEFDYYINSDYYGGETQYILHWNDPSSNKNVRVTADAKGNILSYEQYDHKGTTKLNYLMSELEKTALAVAEKANPCMKGHLKLESSQYEGRYQNSYEYTFRRTENGIPMDNYIQVSINAETKELNTLVTHWMFDVEVPSAKATISKEKAKEIIKKEVKMELKYLTKWSYKDGEYTKGVYLAYVPTKEYISIDAKTGEVYTTQQEWQIRNTNATMADKSMEEDSGNGAATLSAKEIEALNKLDQLLSEDEAVKLITGNKKLYLDKSAISVSTRLVHWEDEYYWRITFEDPSEIDYSKDDYYRASAYAMVDAKKGTIVSYDASINPYESYKEKSLESVDSCKDKLLTFVKTIDKDMVKNSKLGDTSTKADYVTRDLDQIPRTSDFRYYRVNEGVIYEGNYFYGGVDRVTGKIYNFYSNWDKKLKFESPKNAMSADKAMDCYLNLEGFQLAYEQNIIHTYDKGYEQSDDYYYNKEAYSQTNQIRLVYNTSAIKYSKLSPFTGKPINSDGEEVADKKAVNNSYSDIANHPYERSIRLLSDIGLGYEKDQFKPDELITKDDFLKFMDLSGLYYRHKKDTSLKDYRVTRQQAAEFIISTSGLSSIAKLPGIFKTDYADEASISKEALGAVALCKGLKLLQFGKDNTFGPNEKLTRAEVAQLVIDMYNLSEE
ncbi:MAG: S-layer homology domain-containing protein, partial [Clostridiales bacterium]|nr:S-layer homology domain-containing protein [Clostridiales bacterium]